MCRGECFGLACDSDYHLTRYAELTRPFGSYLLIVGRLDFDKASATDGLRRHDVSSGRSG